MKRTLLVALIPSLASCLAPAKLDPNYCGNNDGDAFCSRMDASKPFCVLTRDECLEASGISINDEHGCVAQEPAPECRSECGIGNEDMCTGTAVSTATMSTTGTNPTTDPTMGPGSGTTTGTDTETTGDPSCETNDDCMDADAPFCADDGSCVPCDGIPESDAACAELDPGVPVCDEGQCVQCTDDNAAACGDQTPVCDAGDNLCVACTEHAQCPDSACHLDGADVGGCFDEGDIQNIANTGALDTALAGLADDDQAVLVLAAGTYSVTADVGGGAGIAILGEGSPTLAGDGSRAVDAFSSSLLYLSGVQVVNGAGDGISCSGTSIWLDDSEIRNNAEVGLDISGGCAAHLRRSVVRANGAGGVVASGGEVHLVNSAIGENLSAQDIAGLRLTNGELYATYSTIVANLAVMDSADNIQCFGTPSGEVRNSIIVADAGNSISACGSIDFANNAVDTSALGGSNDNVGYNAGWFSATAGDFHLTTAGEPILIDKAEWQDGDPITDIDGEPIPNDISSFPGYDQP